MLVVIRRARLPKILEDPDLLLTTLNVTLRFDRGKAAQCPEAIVRPRSSSMEHRIIGIRILRHDAPEMGVHRAIHRTIKCLVCLDATIEEPTPR